MEVLNRQLESERLLVGDCWGAADCAVQAHLGYLPLFSAELDLSPYPGIQAVLSAPTSGLPSGWSWVLPEV
tara:strand:- start:5 stop:217 length:213 start_codon:yes stop_codon:yes gene_type:complete